MLFGGRLGGSEARARQAYWVMRGQDHVADITISVENAYYGTKKTLKICELTTHLSLSTVIVFSAFLMAQVLDNYV